MFPPPAGQAASTRVLIRKGSLPAASLGPVAFGEDGADEPLLCVIFGAGAFFFLFSVSL